MAVRLTGTVLEVRPGPKVTRVMVAGSGRTNDLLMVDPAEVVKVGDKLDREVRPAIERSRDNRVTGFITFWDAAYGRHSGNGAA